MSLYEIITFDPLIFTMNLPKSIESNQRIHLYTKGLKGRLEDHLAIYAQKFYIVGAPWIKSINNSLLRPNQLYLLFFSMCHVKQKNMFKVTTWRLVESFSEKSPNKNKSLFTVHFIEGMY